MPDRMPERNSSHPQPDRLYLLAIVLYALLAVAFGGYFAWWLLR